MIWTVQNHFGPIDGQGIRVFCRFIPKYMFLNVESIKIYRFRKNPYQIPWRRFTKVGVAVSKKITDTEETVRVVIYGGKTATGIVPLGTKAMASWASGVLPTGLAPPPGSPGKGFPAGINP